ncbi:hypothetical protein HS088_TW04G01496 [Tripterygium wilfordii]|uniref:Uncharacterized protein n=1 Tax=Tripterygium wilfordii TaxID=458696 RepID=A0A7J7DT87_TRIWF|nr:hypothetical protein HS088_TW04G01496 [Tripterygium wilfordii]
MTLRILFQGASDLGANLKSTSFVHAEVIWSILIIMSKKTRVMYWIDASWLRCCCICIFSGRKLFIPNLKVGLLAPFWCICCVVEELVYIFHSSKSSRYLLATEELRIS